MSAEKPVRLCGVWLAVGLLVGWLALPAAHADGPGDNQSDKVRPVPPPGIAVDKGDLAELGSGLSKLDTEIEQLAQQADAAQQRLLLDVRVCSAAVHSLIDHQEFFHPDDVKRARKVLALGSGRAKQLADGQAKWPTAAGPTVRAYVSKIDGSTQPYGLEIPDSYSPTASGRYRLDIWFHGRGETLSESNFIAERSTQRGQFHPPDTFVLHPYGRYCNAFKFAGEVDVLEALDDVRRQYRIDDDRVSVRGFSMGGAAAWHFAVHYADRWVAANPGAGFAETAEFLHVFQRESVAPPDYERKLWHMYDATDYAGNLRHCPTVAYSGEIDAQKQAADIMAKYLSAEGMELKHVIGPGTKHAYHPQAAREVDEAMAAIAARGRERVPPRVSLTTYTLKYNRMAWLTIDSLGEHWQRARVEAKLTSTGVTVERVENVTALTFAMPAGWCPFDVDRPTAIEIEGTRIEGTKPLSDRSWSVSLHREGRAWKLGPPANSSSAPLRKRHDLQGPIDDALMDSFIFVRPTGKSKHAAVDGWVHAELDHAVEEWRRQFRGQARVKDDTAISDADIASANLILWGDADSNALVRRIADRLPIHWSAQAIEVGAARYPAESHAVVMVYPNPLNPNRYAVLNSGFTFREYDYLSNARQVPKLPDWAVIDLSVPPGPRYPGKVVAADFFSESWELRTVARSAAGQ